MEEEIFLTQTPNFQQSHQSFFIPLGKLQAEEKNRPQKDKRKPLSLSSRGGKSQQAPRTPWLRQTLHLQKAALDVMLPYGFTAMMGLSQTLPAECCRLWLEESISYSHNRCSQWCSQQRQTGKPGMDTPTTGSTLFLFFLSPGNFLSSRTTELTVLLQQTTELHSLKAS